VGGSPTFDAGVENLERFIAAISRATAEVQQSAEVLQQHADALEEMAHTVEETVGGLATDVENLRDEVEDGYDEAKDDVEGLGRSAHDAAEGRLSSAEESLERGGAAFGERISGERADWDKDSQELSDQGFRALDSELETLKQETQASQQETEAAFEALEGALQTLQGEADTLRSETASRMEAFQHSLEDATVAEIHNEASEAMNGFSSLKDELEAECSSIAQEEQQFYSTWLDEQKQRGHEVQDSFKTLVEETTDELGSLGREGLEGPVDEAVRASLDPLLGELDEVESQVSSEEPTITELGPLVEDLDTAKHVVGDIDQVLQSMDD
jgi:uncharacterized phage infection (PIP) family protein YhgE